jgi:RimJ/RimL family protein N-acetyltransferase
MPEVTHLDQPVGAPVAGWTRRPAPPRTAMIGRLCGVEPLERERHAAALHAAFAEDREARLWAYLPYGPFARVEDFCAHIDGAWSGPERLVHAIVNLANGQPVGVASYLNIDPAAGSIEVGGITYAPALARSAAATEAMFLMMRRAFDELGYRRYAWQCNALNAASRAAAARLGFRYEGTWRQAAITKGRTRDTAWFSILDSEWPERRAAFERWLDPANFDRDGRQRARLARPAG